MRERTLNEDGSLTLIEALYSQYGCLYAEECDSLEEAQGFLDSGDEAGSHYGIGICVEGEPTRFDGMPPTAEQAENMRQIYGKIKAHRGPGAPT